MTSDQKKELWQKLRHPLVILSILCLAISILIISFFAISIATFVFDTSLGWYWKLLLTLCVAIVALATLNSVIAWISKHILIGDHEQRSDSSK